jgi:hypothetical protein
MEVKMKIFKINFVTILAVLCIASMSYSETVIPVEAGAGEGADLTSALIYVNSGAVVDPVIELVTDGGEYFLHDADSNIVPITIRAAADLTEKPVIKVAEGDTVQVFFRAKSDFTIQGIIMDGQRADGTYNPLASFIWFDAVDGVSRPDYMINDCVFKNIFETGDPVGDITGSAMESRNGALAGTIRIENSIFMNYADEPILMQQVNKTPESVDSVIIRNCTFYNSSDNAKNQGQFTIKSDQDAATADPKIVLENLTFYNCGTAFAIRDCPGTIVRNIIIANNNPLASGGTIGTIGNAGSVISHVDTFQVAGGLFKLDDFKIPGDVPGELDSETVYNLDPMFADPANGDFMVKNPALYSLAHDGGLLGDRRWADPTISTRVDHASISGVPTAFSLSQNYPNPFNPTTTIHYSLDKKSQVKLQVFSITGGLVATLVDGSIQAGQHMVSWDASNVTSGIYFYQITADGQSITRKMTLLR